MFPFEIEKHVPRFLLRDRNGHALAKAIEAGVQMMNDVVRAGVRAMSDYDDMPEWRLDELAWETNFLYDYRFDTETKRRLLKNVLGIYRRLGTKRAVENALQAVFPGSLLLEWFDYDGEPYHFRMEVDLSRTGLTPEQRERALRNIQFYKNVRSVLDVIDYIEVNEDALLYAGAAVLEETAVDACETLI